MSTNSECVFVEPVRGKWYYVLEDFHAPKNAWDWREYARTYGPFSSKETARNHLQNNHANPGGYSEITHENFKTDEVYKRLFNEARR